MPPPPDAQGAPAPSGPAAAFPPPVLTPPSPAPASVAPAHFVVAPAAAPAPFVATPHAALTVSPPAAAPAPVASLAPAAERTAPKVAPQPHTPIDIAKLRRPKQHIRSTVVTTTVVGLFVGLLAAGGVLAWRAIGGDGSETNGTAASATTVAPTTPPSTAPVTTKPPPAPALEVSGADWMAFEHPPFTLRVPPTASVVTDANGTVYTSSSLLLTVSIGTYTAVGAEDQAVKDTLAFITADVGGVLGTTSSLNSLGKAYRATIDNLDGTWTHVRMLFLNGTLVIVIGKGGEVEPSAVVVAWSGISYGGVVATAP